MFKLFNPLAVTIFVFMLTTPAYCAGSRTIMLQVSATLPEHIMDNQNSTTLSLSSNPYQLIQTQTVIRNNQPITLKSIVVP